MVHEMNEKCPECGAILPLENAHGLCPKCLLNVGVEAASLCPLDTQAVTLPPSGHVAAPQVAASHGDADDGEGIGAYRNLKAIHDWSGGTVYTAHHPGLDRRVLLRVFDSSVDPQLRENLLRRAEVLSHLNHPHTATTLEAGEDKGVAFVAEELVDGRPIGGYLPRTWRQRWSEGFYPGRQLICAMRDAALGLNAIHEVGVIHGRLNPDSVLVDGNGMVRIVGLGKDSDVGDDRFAGPNSLDQDSIAGDLYRLGATFCFLISGKLPTEIDPTLSERTLTKRLERLNSGVSRDTCHVISRCLNQSGGSYASAGDVAEHLGQLLTRSVRLANWRRRAYSGFFEAFCILVLIGLIQSSLARAYFLEAGQQAWVMALLFAIPFAYVTTFESLLGWTLMRQLFGLRLLNQAGERRPWWRRAARAVLKCVLLAALFFVPALVAPGLSRAGVDPTFSLVMAVIWVFSPLYLMYLPARWIGSHWTYYDLLTGVTWGEESLIDPDTGVSHSADVWSSPQTPVVDRVDQYDIHESLGSGGMGSVYRAFDRVLGREVAIKALAGHLKQGPLLIERFQREARLAAKVSHPNVAKVFGNGVWNETPYIAMEYVQGRNLQEIIQREGRIPLATAWNYITQAALALEAADRNGVVHRDVKPANLMITGDGRLKVTDFGVSRQTQVGPGVTEAGTVVGTPAYMAPEQAMGKDVDCRSDIYALGMTLYHMLSGSPPFKGANAVELLAQQMAQTPSTLLSNVDGLTTDQNNVVIKMIAKKPDDRYHNYADLLADLQRHVPGVDRCAYPLKRIAAETCNWVAFYFCFTTATSSVWLFGSRLGLDSESGTQAVGWMMAAFMALFVAMHVHITAGSGSTPGKQLLGLRVIRISGARVGYGRALLRFLAAFPLFAVCAPLMLFGVISHTPISPILRIVSRIAFGLQLVATCGSLAMLWMHPQRRTIHDLIAGTLVVRRDS